MYEAELKEARYLLEQNSSELAKKHDLQTKTAAMVRDLTAKYFNYHVNNFEDGF